MKTMPDSASCSAPPVTAAARKLAEIHGLDVDALVRTITTKFLSVRDVQRSIELRQKEAERQRTREAIPKMSHAELRKEAKAKGLRNSFDGSTTTCMRNLLLQPEAGIPDHVRQKASLLKSRESAYELLLSRVTLAKLADCLPETAWQHYVLKGWLQINLELSSKERRMIALCHRVALCELGCDPTNPSTWQHAEHVSGYDSAFGWLRDPGASLAQVYLATHPRLYCLYVGLFARLLLQLEHWPPGIHNEGEAIRACVELRLQLYNTKIALPRIGRAASFSHLDCDWKRGGCNQTPAPQALVATSPQVSLQPLSLSSNSGHTQPSTNCRLWKGSGCSAHASSRSASRWQSMKSSRKRTCCVLH